MKNLNIKWWEIITKWANYNVILLSQIEQIDEIINDKEKIYNLYKEELKDHPNKISSYKEDVCNSCWNMVMN